MPLLVVVIIVSGRKSKSVNHTGKTRNLRILFSIFIPNLIMIAGHLKVMNISANFKDGHSSKYMLPDRTSEKQICKRKLKAPSFSVKKRRRRRRNQITHPGEKYHQGEACAFVSKLNTRSLPLKFISSSELLKLAVVARNSL